jgi:hypothetical protein
MDIEVTVEGVSDPRIAKQIQQVVREAGRQAGQRGEWSVLVAPSETRGEWDIGVRGPEGHHFTSFRADPAELPHLIEGQVRAVLALPSTAALRRG